MKKQMQQPFKYRDTDIGVVRRNADARRVTKDAKDIAAVELHRSGALCRGLIYDITFLAYNLSYLAT